jgi:hypothetical protein
LNFFPRPQTLYKAWESHIVNTMCRVDNKRFTRCCFARVTNTSHARIAILLSMLKRHHHLPLKHKWVVPLLNYIEDHLRIKHGDWRDIWNGQWIPFSSLGRPWTACPAKRLQSCSNLAATPHGHLLDCPVCAIWNMSHRTSLPKASGVSRYGHLWPTQAHRLSYADPVRGMVISYSKLSAPRKKSAHLLSWTPHLYSYHLLNT